MFYCSSIHQPSSATFYSFNNLILMSAGKVVYFDSPSRCLGYLKRIGYNLPRTINQNGKEETLPYNPADFVIELLFSTEPQEISEASKQVNETSNGDSSDNSSCIIKLSPQAQERTVLPQEVMTPETRFSPRFVGWWPRYILVELYSTEATLQIIKSKEEVVKDVSNNENALTAAKENRPLFWGEFCVLLRRTAKTTSRSSKIGYLAAAECIFIALLAGFTWYVLPNLYT
jgi:hypothetical protein